VGCCSCCSRIAASNRFKVYLSESVEICQQAFRKTHTSMSMKTTLLLFLLALVFSVNSGAQTSSLVSIDSEGNLRYTPDANGNVIPDFSMVGYHQGEIETPNIPAHITLSPSPGDRHAELQNAINAVAALTPNANGFRGAVLLTAGYYEVSETLTINTSGIVIRGEGKDENGTVLELTATSQIDLFAIGGSSNVVRTGSTTKQIVDSYGPIGAKTVTVESGHSFEPGDRVILTLTINGDWIALLGADQLETECGAGHTNWPIGSTNYKRKVVDVSGDQITLDAPIVDPIDSRYNTATLSKYTWNNKIEECGIEDIRLLSSYASDVDENHGWAAIEFRNIENAWVKNVNALHFGYTCVSALAGAYQITVEDCGMFDYKSQVTGSRRYGFYSDDSDLILFKNCVSDQGRHDFTQGSKTPGPNVYTNCRATNSTNDTGPHHRWATGTLWDVVSTNDAINVQNRKCSGSGHGWAGAQQVLWNCTSREIILHDPPANPTNWAIGCTADINNVGDFDNVVEPLGIVESENIPIAAIPSLYEAQLNNRLMVSGIENQDAKNESSANVLIYPNPASSQVDVKAGQGVELITVSFFNQLGQLVKAERDSRIDISSLLSGIYLVTIETTSGIATQKVVIQ